MEPFCELWKNLKEYLAKYISKHVNELCNIETDLYSDGRNRNTYMLLLQKFYP